MNKTTTETRIDYLALKLPEIGNVVPQSVPMNPIQIAHTVAFMSLPTLDILKFSSEYRRESLPQEAQGEWLFAIT